MPYVALEHHQCVVCGELYPTNTIYLDTKLRDHAFTDKPLVTGLGLCPEHQALRDDDYIALIEIIPPSTNEPITIRNAERTGNVAHVRTDVFRDLFNAEPPDAGIAFIDQHTLDVLRQACQQPDHENSPHEIIH